MHHLLLLDVPGTAKTPDGSSDWIFWLILVLAAVGAFLVVRWSKRRGERQAALQKPRSERIRAIGEVDEDEEEAAPTPSPAPAPRPVPVPRPAPAPAPEPEPEPEPEPVLSAEELRKAKIKEPFLVTDTGIREGLEKTRSQGFVSRLAGIFKKDLDENLEQQLEEVLLTSDIGIRTAQKLLARVRENLGRQDLRQSDKVWTFLRREVQDIFEQVPESAEPKVPGPLVISVVGVNGTGKTTTIGKLAHRYVSQGKKVLVVAADTYRAAAGDQLNVWADRVHASFFQGPEGRDPSSVAFDGIKQGVADQMDVILVDTAGRLHTNKNLVEELKKMTRVCGKALEGAPHQTLLVLDATIGQNAIAQAQTFTEGVGVTGIVLTKLDGTAKGGVIIGIADMLRLPVQYVGIGEKLEDLKPFHASEFIEALFGEATSL